MYHDEYGDKELYVMRRKDRLRYEMNLGNETNNGVFLFYATLYPSNKPSPYLYSTLSFVLFFCFVFLSFLG